MPRLPRRRRSAENSRRRRDWQNSHKPTASKLPMIKMRTKRASSRVLGLHQADPERRPPPPIRAGDTRSWTPRGAAPREASRHWLPTHNTPLGQAEA